MSDTINTAVAALTEKLGEGFDASAKFVLGDEGSVIVDENGVRAGDDDADVTLTADVDTFEQILSGALNPTGAFMSGKLTIDGDMSAAMRLASALA